MTTTDADLDGRGGLTVRTADLALAEPVRWLWQRRIALGYLNLLIGNEGCGKGTLIAWLVARITRGDLPGELRGHPAAVGILGDEDSFGGVWVPRLHAAGADLSLVKQLERPDGGFVNLREDRDALARAVEQERLRLLYFDQLLDNLGAGTDDWRQKAVRDALQPLRAIAREFGIAAIGSLHPNKRADSFRSLVAGAAAFNAVSRSSLLLAQHPDDEHRRVLVRGKGNLSAAPRAVEFELTGSCFEANGHTFNVPLARAFTVGELTADELIDTTGTRTLEHSKVGDAREIIEALLPRDGDWHATAPILEACAGEQIEQRTVQRAKQQLAIEHRRAQTFPASTEWRWRPTGDTSTPSDVASASVASDAPESPLRSSDDTHDSGDHDNEGLRAVATANGTSNGYRDEYLQGLIDSERARA